MNRKTQKRTARWSERTPPVELASPYADAPRATRREPDIAPQTGIGPYESQYDITLGYGQDQRIVLP